MKAMIVHSNEIVTLLGPARSPDAVLDESLGRASVLVAADGGAAVALARAIVPDAVIGDFDSLDAAVTGRIPPDRLHKVTEQDSTDFEKALSRIDAPLVLAVGFTGQRLDHELAVYNALVRHPDRRVIVIGEQDICFHLPAPLRLDLPEGARVSLFPMARMRCASTGLRWATDVLEFDPAGRIGTSNMVAHPPVTLRPYGPGMLVIMARRYLDAAIAALIAG
ncbi:MAG: thiamine diphosphokinase [Rhodobacter sp.]|nr:thiamine diphosphokinase [Rhodobacter sp.]